MSEQLKDALLITLGFLGYFIGPMALFLPFMLIGEAVEWFQDTIDRIKDALGDPIKQDEDWRIKYLGRGWKK